MKNKLKKYFTFITILIVGGISGICLRHFNTSWNLIKKPIINFINYSEGKWNEDFFVVNLKSSSDDCVQQIYCYKSKSSSKKPLIVSLHTWDGDYSQKDDLADICRTKELNYIHPDFRGANKTPNACCSELALTDIDDAISYAIENFNVDTSKIYVVGVSGGGYATLSTFMKSKHNIKKFSAWASITDLISWHKQSEIRKIKHADDILKCTNSEYKLNIEAAKEKSPIFWDTPTDKLKKSTLAIHAGIYDGIQGNVPITHSVNMYNKILKDMHVTDSSMYVSVSEKLSLLEFKIPLGDYGYIGKRKIFLKKKYNNLSLVIFDGNHEILNNYALDDLINN